MLCTKSEVMEKKASAQKNTKQGINDNKIIPYSSLTANEI
jgi:hypothetical protein